MLNAFRSSKMAIAALALAAIAANANHDTSNLRTITCHSPSGTISSTYQIGRDWNSAISCNTKDMDLGGVIFKADGFFKDKGFTTPATSTIPVNSSTNIDIYVKYVGQINYEYNGQQYNSKPIAFPENGRLNIKQVTDILVKQLGEKPTKEEDDLYTYEFLNWGRKEAGYTWIPYFMHTPKTINAELIYPHFFKNDLSSFTYTVNKHDKLPKEASLYGKKVNPFEKAFAHDWKFVGWSSSKNGTDNTFFTVPDETAYTKFYAHFTKEIKIKSYYRNRVHENKVTIDYYDTQKDIDQKAQLVLSKKNKLFEKDLGDKIEFVEKWEKNKKGVYEPTKTATKPKQYTIEFAINGHVIKTITDDYGTVVSLDMPGSVKGYTYSEWKIIDKKNNTIRHDNKTISLGKNFSNLFAESKLLLLTYRIYLNNGNSTDVDNIEYNVESDDIILPHLKNTKSHIFEGWFDNENFAGAPVTKVPHGSIGDIELYAKWTPKPIEVKIRGSIEDTIIYDGKKHFAQTFEIETNDPSYTAKDFKFNGKNYISAIEAGEYSMGLKASDFENTNPDFKNVKFEVTDGKLTIAKRKITISSASAQKAYDGKPLTSHKINIDGEFTKDEGIEIEWDESAAQTEVGTAKNSFHIAAKKGTNLENYDIELDYGELTVTEQEKKEEKADKTDFEKKDEENKDKEEKTKFKKNNKDFKFTGNNKDDGKTAIESLASPNFTISTNGRSIEINNAVIGSKFAIYDMQGRLVRMAKISHGTEHVDLENSGSYIIKTFNRAIRVNID
ncbi:MAG: hypothetical protein MJY82_01765 [Fibrobacter sp.]|nr:hypothetical protein [Fibrobacter sp.]